MTERREGFPFVFACRRSGNCCAIPGGFVRTTPAEQARIAARLGLEAAAFRTRYVQPDGVTLKAGLGHRCVFLQDGAPAGCEIYADRPEQCRTWPFWPRLRTDAALLQLALRTCPGLTPLPAAAADGQPAAGPPAAGG